MSERRSFREVVQLLCPDCRRSDFATGVAVNSRKEALRFTRRCECGRDLEAVERQPEMAALVQPGVDVVLVI